MLCITKLLNQQEDEPTVLLLQYSQEPSMT